MFTTHFNLTAQPFMERMPVERIVEDDRMAQGLARLRYLAEAGSIALVTGATGVGKSSLLKLFFHALSRNRYHPVYVHLTNVNTVGLLRLIVRSVGEVPKRGKESLFLQVLEYTQKAEATTILIVDEAHLTDPDALVDLRLLLSSAVADEPPLKLILTGQDALRTQLKRASHTDLVHRISVRYHLVPLTPEGTGTYLDVQMRTAGGSDKVFEPEAKAIIHDYTGGLPRQINNVATACLINAAAKNVQKINEPLVNETMAEFHLP